jgi:hypothetical protein
MLRLANRQPDGGEGGRGNARKQRPEPFERIGLQAGEQGIQDYNRRI